MPITWTILSGDSFFEYKNVWEELRSSHDHGSALDFDFAAQLIKHFGEPKDLLALGYEHNTPVAITVLRQKNLGRWETFWPSQSLIGFWLQRPNAPVEVLLQSLLKALPGFSLMIGLSQQDPKILPRPSACPSLDTCDHVTTASIALPGNIADYWSQLPKNVRKQTERRMRRLAEDGVTARLETIEHVSDAVDAIANYASLETAGWKGRQGTAVQIGNLQGQFYQSVMEVLCRNAKGRIYRYWFNEQIAAMELVMVVGNTAIFLKTAYDESLKPYAPGILMRWEIIKDLIENTEVRNIEFYGRIREWQVSWANGTRAFYHINFYRNPAIQLIHCGLVKLRLGRSVIPALVAKLRTGWQTAKSAIGEQLARLPNQLARARQLRLALGWFDTCLYAFAKTLGVISMNRIALRKYYFLSQPIPDGRLLRNDRGVNIQVNKITSGDNITKQFPRPKEVIAHRFTAGADCFAANINGQFAGFVWLQKGTYIEDEVRCRFSPLPEQTTAWDFDVFVIPKQRIGFTFCRLWDEVNSSLRSNGIQWTVSRVSAFNPGSLNSHSRLGARIVGSACFLSLGNWQLMFTTHKPRFHLSFSKLDCPEVWIAANKLQPDRRHQQKSSQVATRGAVPK
ncbi:MAG TPA: GNAT family N-acetyltransferase [Burkholderiales bacterium]|nr:GNAT family N-acetyltransferase [Burkholderiales bacterium]